MRVLLVGLGLLAACDSATPLSDRSLKVEMTYQGGEVEIQANVLDGWGYNKVDDPSLRIAVRLRGEEIGLARRFVEFPYAATRMIDPAPARLVL